MPLGIILFMLIDMERYILTVSGNSFWERDVGLWKLENVRWTLACIHSSLSPCHGWDVPSCSSSLSFDFPMAMGCMLNCKLKEALPHLNCTCPKSVSSQQQLRPIHLLGHSGFDELPTTGLPWCGWFDCAVLIHPSRFCFSLTSSHLLYLCYLPLLPKLLL